MNLARKSSQLFIEEDAITFAERLWNGMLDWRLEQIMIRLLSGATANYTQVNSANQSSWIITTELDKTFPFSLSESQRARIRSEFTTDMILAYPVNHLRSAADAVWFEIQADGSTE